MYVKELDRIVLKDKTTERLFGNLGTVRSVRRIMTLVGLEK